MHIILSLSLSLYTCLYIYILYCISIHIYQPEKRVPLRGFEYVKYIHP